MCRHDEWKIDDSKVKPLDAEFYQLCAKSTVAELHGLIARGANPNVPIYFVDVVGDGLREYFYAIHEAARNPDIEVLKFVISLGVDPCETDFWGRQPLAYAVENNSLEIVKFLVDIGNDPTAEDVDGATVLYDAALNPDVEVCRYLLAQGAELEVGAVDMSPLGRAFEYGTIGRMKFFMNRGANLANAVEHGVWRAPLSNIRFALENGYDPNAYDGYGKEKIIDRLDAERQALFLEFGGVVARSSRTL